MATRDQTPQGAKPAATATGPLPDERQSLLSFYQRYSYSSHGGQGPRRRNTDTNSLLNPETFSSRWQNAKTYLNADVSTRWTDIILVACFFISGLVDSGAYNAYECFVSMQTGNTIFAALGVSDLPISAPKYAWTKSVTSILCFLLGALVISTLHRQLGERKRWVMAASFALQMVMTMIAASMVSGGKSSESPVKDPSISISAGISADIGFPSSDLIPIGVLSFQAAGKVLASRILGMNAMPAVVLTTLYNDLMSDPGLLSAGLMSNVQRNRRAVSMVAYFGGAVIGGACAKSLLGFAGALWLSAGLTGGIVIAWLLWHEERKEEASSQS